MTQGGKKGLPGQKSGDRILIQKLGLQNHALDYFTFMSPPEDSRFIGCLLFAKCSAKCVHKSSYMTLVIALEKI